MANVRPGVVLSPLYNSLVSKSLSTAACSAWMIWLGREHREECSDTISHRQVSMYVELIRI